MLRTEQKDSDTWNVTSLFPSIDLWKKELTATVDDFPKILAFRSKLADSIQTLHDALSCYFSLERRLRKLYTWAHLRHDEDIAKTDMKEAFETITGIYHQFAQTTSWLQPELLHIADDTFKSYLQAPDLQEYHFFLEKLYRLKPHTLPTEQEELMALAEQALDAPHKAFSAINNADFVFGSVLDSAQNERELTHATYGLYLRDFDRELRKNAFMKLHQTFKSYENTITELLSGQVQTHVFHAKARKYSSCLQSALFPKNIDTSVYRALIDAVHSKISALHRYVSLRKKLLNLDELHPYDMYVPLVPSFEMKMSYDEAENVVIESAKKLGSEYVDLLHHGLKTGRWVDRYENKNKRSGAYSSGCFDSMPYILMNYKGILRDVFTLAHEAGHSMHSLYSRKHQPYHYSDYAIFVAEVASTFNEELLTQTLVKRAKSDKEKIFLINEKIEDIRATLFRQVLFAEFELFIHEMAEKRVPLTPKLLSDEFLRLNKFYYGNDLVYDDELAIEWARIPHFYYNFYVYQYATGISAALFLCDRISKGSDADRNAYLEFLRSGSSDYPLNILKKAGVDMQSPAPVHTAIDTFSSLVTELETLLSSADLAVHS